jgi:PhoH-like ATPase
VAEKNFAALTDAPQWQLAATELRQGNSERGWVDLESPLQINEFVVIRNASAAQMVKLGRYDGEKVVCLRRENEKLGNNVFPLSSKQRFLQEMLMMDPGEQRLVIIEGPAGTGKTFYTLAVMLWAIRNGVVKNGLVSRVNLQVDREYGFLPGALAEKFDHYLAPFYINLRQIIGNLTSSIKDGLNAPSRTNSMVLEEQSIICSPLNYLQGCTFVSTMLWLDEAENASFEQTKLFIERAGKGSPVILTGDVTASLLGSETDNGLAMAWQRFANQKMCWRLRLDGDKDNQRSELARLSTMLMRK